VNNQGIVVGEKDGGGGRRGSCFRGSGWLSPIKTMIRGRDTVKK